MPENTTRRAVALIASGAAALGLAACGSGSDNSTEAITASGSSTVAPITEAVARQGRFDLDLAAEGTIDGFTRFCSGESAINNASVAIPGAGEEVDFVAMCEDNGVDYIELPIALDALSLVRNEANTFATDLTLAELKRIWEPDSQVQTWRDVRSEWPEQPISLYGRPSGSGTFDYFTHFVVGQTGSIRSDYQGTDDIAELAAWIADDDNALGFMGVGNYLAADEEYRDRMTNVAVDGVLPSMAEAQEGRYRPLTRPLLVYVSVAALEADENIGEFVSYYLSNVENVLPRVYYYALPAEAYSLSRERFDQRVTGTAFGGDPFSQRPVLEALRGSS